MRKTGLSLRKTGLSLHKTPVPITRHMFSPSRVTSKLNDSPTAYVLHLMVNYYYFCPSEGFLPTLSWLACSKPT